MKPAIGVIGAGSWGTALANLLALNGHDVHLWVFEEPVLKEIRDHGENKTFLPGIRLEPNIRPTGDLAEAASRKDILLLVVPSHVYRGVVRQAASSVDQHCVVASAAKGIENDSLDLMSEVLDQELSHRVASRHCFLSGPSFAREVAAKLPTAVTAASHSHEAASLIQKVFSNEFFRVYTSQDVVGVELGGAVKNVVAIAAGACQGLELGQNTLAALITRGLAEMTRLGIAMGANPLSFAGLAGIGDLVLTCTSGMSRNQSVGFKLGRGMTLAEILKDMVMVAEGVRTSISIHDLSHKHGIEMPICEQVYRILYKDKSPMEAVKELMTRELKSEFSGIEAL